jgi:dephospho-CoA kinase
VYWTYTTFSRRNGRAKRQARWNVYFFPSPKRPAKPIVIGLTGSIGMGKSTTARILKSMGFPVHSADRAIHKTLQREGKGVKQVARLFPEAMKKNAINRKRLGEIVFAEPAKLKKLEKILHPYAERTAQQFITGAAKKKAKAIVLEIPLLFETKAEKFCDITICVTAPRRIQKERVLKRRGMTKAKFHAILKRQLPDKEKRRRADYVIDTSKSYTNTKKQLIEALNDIIP